MNGFPRLAPVAAAVINAGDRLGQQLVLPRNRPAIAGDHPFAKALRRLLPSWRLGVKEGSAW